MEDGLAANPFADQDDPAVVEAAQQGDRGALTTLVARHRPWVYNISLRMLGDPGTAEDATQDIFIKVLSRIGTYEERGAFRTWLYRVAFHHLLNLKRTRFENAVGDFDNYEAGLRMTPNVELGDEIPAPERELLIEEAKIACMTGMLLCLNRDQRLAFVLGTVFGLSAPVAAELVDVEPATFRKRLQRAREDLGSFMSSNCGLIDPANSCRCARKTKVFMDAGYLDRKLTFQRDRVAAVSEVASHDAAVVYEKAAGHYPTLYREHPFSDPAGLKSRLATLLDETALGDLLPDGPAEK